MSNSSKARVKRGAPPAKVLKWYRYRNALPELLRDFGGRCAYSMQHQERAGLLEVDHFDPRAKSKNPQNYENLFPVSRHCNCRKSDHWPTAIEAAAGCRFLNPCEEWDYGHQIFEDSASHRLVGTTPAAIWHIRMCGLNADHLINERSKRAEYTSQLKHRAIRAKHSMERLPELIASFRREVEVMIPEIASPPAGTPGQILM